MFKADTYVKSVLEIDLQKLKANGIKLLCFDLDNTLDYPDKETKTILPKITEFLDEVEKDFEIYIISNNSIESRVSSFAELRNYQYLAAARKPFLKKYNNNKILNSFEKNQICFIGDKVITDIIGGNRFGSHTILVDPLFPRSKHWYSVVMMVVEEIFTKLVGFKRGKYYDNL